MKTIRIRSASMRVLAEGALGVIVERSASVCVERCDLWERDSGPTTVGITWVDHSFCITDWTDPAAARRWVMSQPALARRVVEHA